MQHDPMPDDEQQIRQLIERWLAATRRGDSEAVLALVTDDVLFLRPGHAPMDRTAFAAQARAQAGAGGPRIEAESRIAEVGVLGDHAYVRSHLRVRVTPVAGAPQSRAGDVLSIFRRDAGHWRLARDANLLAPDDSA
jgi:uncharacterized protein (TIGR02246 family)